MCIEYDFRLSSPMILVAAPRPLYLKFSAREKRKRSHLDSTDSLLFSPCITSVMAEQVTHALQRLTMLPRLPQELLGAIAAHVKSDGDLSSMARASHQLNIEATRVLYHEKSIITWGFGTKFAKTTAMIDRLIDSPHLTSLVHKFCLLGLSPMLLLPSDQRLRSCFHIRMGGLKHMTQLRVLQIVPQDDTLIQPTLDMFGPSFHAPNLHTFHIDFLMPLSPVLLSALRPFLQPTVKYLAFHTPGLPTELISNMHNIETLKTSDPNSALIHYPSVIRLWFSVRGGLKSVHYEGSLKVLRFSQANMSQIEYFRPILPSVQFLEIETVRIHQRISTFSLTNAISRTISRRYLPTLRKRSA